MQSATKYERERELFLSTEFIQDINHEIININSDKSILEMIKSGVSFI